MPGSAPSALPSPRLAGIAIVAATLALHWRAAMGANGYLATGTLTDPDSWTRLIRVLDLWQGAPWYDETIPALNAPVGLSIHWPRLFDLLVLVPAWLLHRLLGLPPKDAVEAAGAWLCPPLHALAALVTGRAAGLLWPGAGPVFAALLLVTSPLAAGYSVVGRADHHTLVLLFGMMALERAMRALASERTGTAMTAGFFGGLGVWISPEGLLFLVPILGAFALAWLFADHLGLATEHPRRCGLAVALGFAAVCLFAVAAEHPPARWLAAEYDKVSAQHVMLGLLAGLVFAAVPIVGGGVARRLAAGGALSVTAAVLFLAWRPAALSASFAGADPAAARLLLPRVAELRSVRLDALGLLSDLLTSHVTSVLALIALAVGWPRWRAEGRLAVALPPALCLLLCLPFALRHLRFGVDLAGPAALFAGGLPTMLVRQAWPLWQRAVLAAIAALGPPAGTIVGATIAPLKQSEVARRCNGDAAIAALGPLLMAQLREGTAAPIVLTNQVDLGPEIVWRTEMRAVAAPYHRGGASLADALAVFAATDPAEARMILERRDVSVLLVCRLAQAGAGSFAARLRDGETPPWLVPQPISENSPFQIHLVRHDRP